MERRDCSCEVDIDVIHLEHVLKFKYLVCVLDKSGTDWAKCNRKWEEGGMCY